MTTLEGKEILIFGGSSGLGYGAAEASLKSKASRVIISSSSSEKVAHAVQRLTSANLGEGKVEGHAVDATDTEALKKFVQQIGEVDHIIWTSGNRLPLGFPNVDYDFMKSKWLAYYCHASTFTALFLHFPKESFDVRYWGAVTVAQNAKFKPHGSLTLTIGAYGMICLYY